MRLAYACFVWCLLLPLLLQGVVHAISPPTWPESYSVAYTLSLPYVASLQPGGLKYDVHTWYDGPGSRLRVQFYGGMDDSWMLPEATYLVYPRITTRTCQVINTTVGPTADVGSEATPPPLPDLKGWSYSGTARLPGRPPAYVWQLTQRFFEKVNTYNFYTAQSDGRPLALRMMGVNIFTGSHFDQYNVDFTSFTSLSSASQIFKPPALCKAATAADSSGSDLGKEAARKLHPLVHQSLSVLPSSLVAGGGAAWGRNLIHSMSSSYDETPGSHMPALHTYARSSRLQTDDPPHHLSQQHLQHLREQHQRQRQQHKIQSAGWAGAEDQAASAEYPEGAAEMIITLAADAAAAGSEAADAAAEAAGVDTRSASSTEAAAAAAGESESMAGVTSADTLNPDAQGHGAADADADAEASTSTATHASEAAAAAAAAATVLQSNLEFIEAWNRKQEQLQHEEGASGVAREGFKLAPNKFVSWTDERWRAVALGRTPGKRGRLMREFADLGEFKRKLSDEELPESVDWRGTGADGPVKDQVSCGSCWAFATTGAMTGAWFKATGQTLSFSEQQIVDCAWDYQVNGCYGGWMEAALSYIHDTGGAALEADYPYKGQNSYCRDNQTAKAAYFAGFMSVPEGDEKAMMEAVATMGPIAISFDAVHPTFKYYSEGVYYREDCGHDADSLNHAVVLVGYGTTPGGTDYWLLRNSWSMYWGDAGYFKMARKGNDCGVTIDGVIAVVDEEKAREHGLLPEDGFDQYTDQDGFDEDLEEDVDEDRVEVEGFEQDDAAAYEEEAEVVVD